MKRILLNFIILIAALLTGCTNNQVLNSASGGINSINASLIKNDLYFLASDSLKGRTTPSPELNSAAKYISDNFAANGVSPVDNSYFQKVKLGYISLAENNSLVIKSKNNEISYKIKKDITPFEMTANKSATAPVVFAGYGIDAPEYRYNDYTNINVKGKIVFVLRHEPGENDQASIFAGKEMTKYSNIDEKVKTAIKYGAVAVLIAQDPLNHLMLTPRGYPWPSLSSIIPDNLLPLTLLEDENEKVPVVQVGENVIGQLFGSADNLKNIQKKIDEDLRPQSFELKDINAALRTSTITKTADASNVIGFIPGSDPALRDRLIILGAHYDHVGIKKEHEKGEDYIYNGADDNASGTTALMAVAKAFGNSEIKPKRSILFIAFCGEEKGLFGSRYYTTHPLFSVKKTVAMINMDMLGRNGIDSLMVYGCSQNPGLTEKIKEVNKGINFHLLLLDKILNGDSDHSSFQNAGIPSVCFHSGMHRDLHKVSDEPDKINAGKIQKTAKLVYLTALSLANE